MPDVLVAGAGPTGLLTAFELERAGLDVLVLERDARPATQSKALALQPRSVEVLADRGLLAAIERHVVARLPGGHFSGIPIDYADLPTRFPYQLGVEQAHVAAAIEARLRTPVLRSAAVTAVTQDDAGVAVAAGGRVHRAGWLVAADGGRTIVADAADTGLDAQSADVVVGEALLTMQSDRAKKAIVDEAHRILRPGGRYAIHELGLLPDSLPQDTKEAIRRDLAQSIKVNARPMTVQEWTDLLTESGFEIENVDRAPMALLRPARVIADEGIIGTLRILVNLLTRPAARNRVLAMRRTFRTYRDALTAVAIVAVVPQQGQAVTLDVHQAVVVDRRGDGDDH